MASEWAIRVVRELELNDGGLHKPHILSQYAVWLDRAREEGRREGVRLMSEWCDREASIAPAVVAEFSHGNITPEVAEGLQRAYKLMAANLRDAIIVPLPEPPTEESAGEELPYGQFEVTLEIAKLRRRQPRVVIEEE